MIGGIRSQRNRETAKAQQEGSSAAGSKQSSSQQYHVVVITAWSNTQQTGRDIKHYSYGHITLLQRSGGALCSVMLSVDPSS